MASNLASLTEQYHQLYQDHPQDAFTFRPSGINNGLRSNPSGLSVSVVRRLSSYVSTKPPPTPPANARGATCDLLDATFCNLDVDTVRCHLETHEFSSENNDRLCSCSPHLSFGSSVFLPPLCRHDVYGLESYRSKGSSIQSNRYMQRLYQMRERKIECYACFHFPKVC